MAIATPAWPEFNMYDVREPCERMGMCYPDDHLWEVLNSYDYRKMWGLSVEEGSAWEMCATTPHLFLQMDFTNNAGIKLAPLLDSGLPVLIYNGDKDYICNWYGARDWTDALVWNNQAHF